MATKEQVIEYINEQFTRGGNDAFFKYWEEESEWGPSRLGLMQNWMSPEIAVILRKLLGDVQMIKSLANNGSNK